MPVTTDPPKKDLSRYWLDYFVANTTSLLAIPWGREAEITVAERRAIASSIQEFQLGESSEGRHLLRSAETFAKRTSDPHYPEAMRLFIKEEQRHARDLGRFMDMAAIPRLQHTWPDRVFRRLRQVGGGLEISISVLITAEIIAKVYYAALREATGSAVLRRLCDQILRDEDAHVRFQCDYLAVIRKERKNWTLALTESLQRFLFFGTCLVVWKSHRRALKQGGIAWRLFWKICWNEMNLALTHMKPRPDSRPLREKLARQAPQQRQRSKYGDQVRQRHQAVHSVRQSPDKVQAPRGS